MSHLVRSLWFWITVLLIAAGVALAAALGIFYWLLAALALAVLLIASVFLRAAYAVGRGQRPDLPQLPAVASEDRISVILDCDLTLGRPFRDVGDGLALLYLLGEPRVDVRAITTTYGNGPQGLTARATRRLLEQLDLPGIPVVPGASGPAEDPQENQAAHYLVEAVAADAGQIVVVATGAMTNLKHAGALDTDFFARLRGLHLMGGATGSLTWNGRRLQERNFSLDPEAAYAALRAECPTTITTGEAGLTAIFRSAQFAALQTMDDPVSELIVRKSRLWFALMRLWFRDDGFGLWAPIAALTVTRPEFFNLERVCVPVSVQDLHAGQLRLTPDRTGPVQVVLSVQDHQGLFQTLFAAWNRLGRLAESERPSL
jgi:inosine-uridine nucleoside N-ribohydrolase